MTPSSLFYRQWLVSWKNSTRRHLQQQFHRVWNHLISQFQKCPRGIIRETLNWGCCDAKSGISHSDNNQTKSNINRFAPGSWTPRWTKTDHHTHSQSHDHSWSQTAVSVCSRVFAPHSRLCSFSYGSASTTTTTKQSLQLQFACFCH